MLPSGSEESDEEEASYRNCRFRGGRLPLIFLPAFLPARSLLAARSPLFFFFFFAPLAAPRGPWSLLFAAPVISPSGPPAGSCVLPDMLMWSNRTTKYSRQD